MEGKKQLLPEMIVRRPPPLNLTEKNKHCFEHEYEKKLAPVFLHTFQRVNVSHDAVVFKGFSPLVESLIYPHQAKQYSVRYLLKQYLKKKRIRLSADKKYLLVCDIWSNGYFHWMCDALPRLMLMKDECPGLVLLLPKTYVSSFIVNSLQMFSFQGIEYIPEDSFVSVPYLVMPGHVASSGNYNPQVMKQIRQAFFNLYQNTPEQKDERIYISRKSAAYRHIVNEEEVRALMLQYGFKIVELEKHAHAEQVALMKAARYVVGCIGAGMVNNLFVQEGGYVLEFREEGDDYNNAYFALTAAMNIHFLSQFCACDRSAYSNSELQNFVKFDLKVDMEELRKNMEMMLEHRNDKS